MQKVKTLLSVFGLSVLAVLSGSAQSSIIPTVTIYASDPHASWSGDTGAFTVLRDGPTNQTLNVYYVIGGSASNGVDYATIGNWAMIPAGIRTNTITISPINRGQTNIETVVLKLSASPMAIPQNYQIGYPAVATVYIAPAGVTNVPPAVKIFMPTSGTIVTTPVDLQIAAFGSDPDGFVSTVEFFAGDKSLGVVSNGAVVDPPFPQGAGPGSRAFFLLWSNPPPGQYLLSAKATDNGGASTLSAPVEVTVLQGPPATNYPPVVKILTPADGAKFPGPLDVPICASAFDLDGYVATVEFFSGSQSLGVKTNNPASASPMNPFCLVWSNVPPGSYTLTAVATDNAGATGTSGPVHIIVAQQQPPPTNYPPEVRWASPPNGAVIPGPINLPLFVFASDRDGTVSSVEFFAGSNSLGLGHGLCSEPMPWPMSICPTNVFTLVWSNAPIGSYLMSAVATDNSGAMATSAPVKITIVSEPPPPTNRPTVVNIVASDPLAIEGTNCWPWLGLDEATPTWSDWAGSTVLWRFFTNCGPKNAGFTVHRWGDTNADLAVGYEIGGSATNGVDYVPLSGSVVIPAGQRHADITVVPLDDGMPDLNSTVILRLTSATNYLLGYPRKAAALILDSKGPRPGSGLLSDHTFHLGAPGPDGAWFHIEYSTNLVDWTRLCTNQVVNGSIDFVDPDAVSDQGRFYRTVPESSAPVY